MRSIKSPNCSLPLGVGRRQRRPERSLVHVRVDLHADAEQLGEPDGFQAVGDPCGLRSPASRAALDERLLVTLREPVVRRLRHDDDGRRVEVTRQAEVLQGPERLSNLMAAPIVIVTEPSRMPCARRRRSPCSKGMGTASAPRVRKVSIDDRILSGAELEPLHVLRGPDRTLAVRQMRGSRPRSRRGRPAHAGRVLARISWPIGPSSTARAWA